MGILLQYLGNIHHIPVIFVLGDVRIICLVERPMYDVTGMRPTSGARAGHTVVCMVFGILTAVPGSGC